MLITLYNRIVSEENCYAMASENVTQLIEKEVLTSVLLGTWNNDDLTVNDDEGTVFKNPLTEEENREHICDSRTLNLSDGKVPQVCTERSSNNTRSHTENDDDPCTRLEFSSFSGKDHEKDDSGASVDENSDKNIDEVDYFDSDEEYLETHGQRYDEEDVLDQVDDSINNTLKGRYSEGVEQYRNIPAYRRSIQKFARDNHFEIYDVIPDGSCMFRAIADQFMINGRIGFTAERLRSTAIDYLREHPFKEDGNHIQSFLCAESWEDYLSRMSKPREWSDHIVLQAVVDVFNLEVVVFNVFRDDVRRTEVQPEIKRKEKRMQIFLGHLGEFHYLSLRPDQWTTYWSYKSLLYRVLMCSKHLPKLTRQELIQQQIKDMGASGIVTEDEYLDMLKLEERCEKGDQDSSSNKMHAMSTESSKDNCLWYFDSYGLDDLQLQEKEDSLSHVVFDPTHIDFISGIPLPHLSYIFKQLFPLYMIKPYVMARDMHIFPHVYAHCTGCFADGNNFILKDISRSQTKRNFYYKYHRKHVGHVVLAPRNKMVLHTDVNEGQESVMNIYADSSETHPGYCQLRLPPNTVISERNIFQKESKKFLKEIELNDAVSFPKNVKVKYKGLICETFPTLAQEWALRERKFTFPSRQLIQTVLQNKCTLIKKAHPQSKEPDIEWKYNFSMAEHAIFTKGLSDSQVHGFRVFKILVDNVTSQPTRQLKNKHLKAVYLNALEDIPCEAWETNFSGCILFIISAMVASLKARILPHYFIPRNNLLDCFSAEEIEAICVNVECLRMFPVVVIQNIAENHGYNYAPKLIKMVFANCKSFVHTNDMTTVFMNALIPGTVCSVKVLTRLGFYDTAFQLLRYVHEQMLLMPMPDDCYEKPSFVELFHVSLKKLRQKSSRIILAKLFDIRFKTNILNDFIDRKELFAKDILPWKMDYRIEYTNVPEDKATDFSSLGEIFYSFSLKEFDKRNSTLAGLALETAITCVEKTIEMDSLSIGEITDDTLKKEILSERERIVWDLKRKLKLFYIQMFAISRLYYTLWPLQSHMDAIEKLCEELPEMTFVVSSMFRFLRREDRAVEYEAKSYFLFKERGSEFVKYNF